MSRIVSTISASRSCHLPCRSKMLGGEGIAMLLLSGGQIHDRPSRSLNEAVSSGASPTLPAECPTLPLYAGAGERLDAANADDRLLLLLHPGNVLRDGGV